MSVTLLYKLRSGRKLSKTATEQTLRDIRELVGFSQHDVGLWVTSERSMAQHNRELRRKQGPTDVISVPVLEFERPKCVKRQFRAMKDLGDMLLCLPYVEKQ